MLIHAIPVIESASLIPVEPASDSQSRQIYLPKILGSEDNPLPIINDIYSCNSYYSGYEGFEIIHDFISSYSGVRCMLNNIDKTILIMQVAGFQKKEISDVLNVTQSAVSQRIKKRNNLFSEFHFQWF